MATKKKQTRPQQDEGGERQLMVRLEHVDELPGNPNVMEEDRLDGLRASVQELGFIQPITVVAQPARAGEPARYWLADGAHRLLVARERNMWGVPALVADVPAGREEQFVRAARLALNRIRGLVDLGAATSDLTYLLAEGWGQDALQACGFSQMELASLLASQPAPLEGVMEQLGEGAPMAEPAAKIRTYPLNLQFTEREDRDWVRSRLTQAGPTCEVGILEILRNGTKEGN